MPLYPKDLIPHSKQMNDMYEEGEFTGFPCLISFDGNIFSEIKDGKEFIKALKLLKNKKWFIVDSEKIDLVNTDLFVFRLKDLQSPMEWNNKTTMIF